MLVRPLPVPKPRAPAATASPFRSILQRRRSLAYRTMIRWPFREMAASIDSASIHRAFDPEKLLIYDPALIQQAARDFAAGHGALFHLAETVCRRADEALTRGPFSVVDKTSLPVSGDPHDYWHPAPYFWPNPQTRNGIPYIKRDGERVPGTGLYEKGSEQYDRSRLQRLFDDGTLLTLAWKISGKDCYAAHAALQLRHWFINPETRMNPHLEYAQIILTTAKGRWSSAGIIETKDFYFYLDAVRLLRAGNVLDGPTTDRFRQWLQAFRTWLIKSRQGRRECSKPNNHGLLYDFQLAALSAYLDDPAFLAAIFRRVQARLFQHIEPDGRQPYELVRTLSAHYCAFNLQGWVNLARLAQNCGFSLWHTTSADGRGLSRALAWLLAYDEDQAWPFQQIAPFEWARLAPLAHVSDSHYGTRCAENLSRSPLRPAPPVCFHPHDGIPPAWQLTLTL